MNSFLKKMFKKFQDFKFWQKSLVIFVLIIVIAGSLNNGKKIVIAESLNNAKEDNQLKTEQKAKQDLSKKESKYKKEPNVVAQATQNKKKISKVVTQATKNKQKTSKVVTQATKNKQKAKKKSVKQSSSSQTNNTAMKVHGNKKTKIYHLPGQVYYNKISNKNLIIFNSEKEAINAGYRKSKR